MTICLSNFHLMYMHIIATGEWTTPSTSGTPPTSRQGHVVAVAGDRMFVHGGMSGQQIFNDIHVLDLSKCSLSLSLSPSLSLSLSLTSMYMYMYTREGCAQFSI